MAQAAGDSNGSNTWATHEGAIMAADTSSSLMEALQNLREGLLHDPSLRTSKEQVQDVSKRKFAACGGADGGVWTPEVARAFFMCLQTFAIPVVPSPAYPGQSFPPPYLFTTPPSAAVPVVTPPAPADDSVEDAAYIPYADSGPKGAVEEDLGGGGSEIMGTAVLNNGPPLFAYAAPTAEAYTEFDPGAAPVVQAEVVQVAQPIFYAGGEQNMQAPEGTLAYTDGDEDTTDVYCNAEELLTTTHLNLFNNDIARIENLGKFTNLLRLTVRSNEIEELSGLSECPTLRWVDVSDNNLKQIGTVSNMHALEWMDVHNNELKTLEGFGQCSRLTFLNVRHSDLHDIRGIEALTALRWLDVSSNEIVHIKGLEKCLFLTEVNLNNNDLADVHSVKPLAHLPYLARLDLSHNNFRKTDIKNIQAYFARVNPKCRVEFDNRKSGLISSWAGDAVSPTGGTTPVAVALEQRSGGSGGSSSSSDICCTLS